MYDKIQLGLLLLAITSCTSKTKDDSQLRQAADVHLHAIEIQKQTEAKLRTLSESTSLTDQQRNKVDSLSKILALWEKGLIEVPGMPHDHHGEHEHKPAPKMTAGSMLGYQEQMLKAIEDVNREVLDLEQSSI